MEEMIPVLGTLVIVVLILVMSYFFSRYIAVRAVRLGGSKHIEIIDRIIVAQDRSIIIIKVNKRYFLVGITSSGMHLLSELNFEDIEEFENNNGKGGKNLQEGFKDLFISLLPPKKK